MERKRRSIRDVYQRRRKRPLGWKETVAMVHGTANGNNVSGEPSGPFATDAPDIAVEPFAISMF